MDLAPHLVYLQHLENLENEDRRIRYRDDPFDILDDSQFQLRFRLSKETVMSLLALVAGRLEFPNRRNNPISPRNRLLTALRFYATGAFLQVIGDTNNCNKATVCRIVHQVSEAIASLAPRFIKLPLTFAEQREVMEGFFQIRGFPGVMGALDCTHIRIQSPGGENAELYRNRKGYFSLNVQTVCDSNLVIRDIVARWPGSTHDSTIFHESYLRARLETGEIANGYHLGDGGYPCKSYLLTPLQNPGTRAEQRYNTAQKATRNTVERQYGVWKRRFPVLSVGLRCHLQSMPNIIVATSVLHNIGTAARENLPPDDPEINRILQIIHQQDELPLQPRGNQGAVQPNYRDDDNPGQATRNAIINRHFT